MSNHWHYFSDSLKKLYISARPVIALREDLIHVYVEITSEPEDVCRPRVSKYSPKRVVFSKAVGVHNVSCNYRTEVWNALSKLLLFSLYLVDMI
jgi:hypothetical protein